MFEKTDSTSTTIINKAVNVVNEYRQRVSVNKRVLPMGRTFYMFFISRQNDRYDGVHCHNVTEIFYFKWTINCYLLLL